MKKSCGIRITPQKVGQKLLNLLVYLLLTECVFLFVFPFLFMFVNSLKYEFDIKDLTKEWLVLRVNPYNYTEAIRQMNYWPNLLKTLGLVTLATLGHLASCMMVGYGIARFKFAGRQVVFGLAILSIIVPPQLFMIPSYILYNKLGWTNTILPIVVPTYFGFGLKGGLFIFLFRQAFKALPPAYEEAAKIEGCSSLKIFLQIILPMVKTTMLVCTMLSFIWHWNDYFEPMMYLKGDNMLLTQLLEKLNNTVYSMSSGSGVTLNPVSLAGCVLVVSPLLIFYFAVSHWFVQGIELSGLAN